MTGCTLCPRRCGVDRLKEKGACRAGSEMLVGAVVIHRGEEPPLIKDSGSGAIFFCGCPMRCSYCQNMHVSRHCRGKTLTSANLADFMIRLQDAGCSNINLVSPTHYSPWIFEALDIAQGQGLGLPLVVNSGGYETRECLDQWSAHAGIYLMDLKYGDNSAGKALSGVPDYWDRAREAIAHLYRAVGPLQSDSGGRAVNGLMVRHLLLPGMLSNPFAVLEFLAGLSADIPLSLMSQYNPAFYQGDIPDMKRTVTGDEYQVVLDRALDLGFTTIYAQDMEAASTYNPDFGDPTPFGDQIKLL